MLANNRRLGHRSVVGVWFALALSLTLPLRVHAETPEDARIMIAPDFQYRGPAGAAHSVWRVADETCKRPLLAQPLLTDGMLFDNKWGPVAVPSGARLFLNAAALQGKGGYGVSISLRCGNVSSFVPAAGHLYQIAQPGWPHNCSLAIIDQSTGAPPDSLISYAAKGHCL
jgi:hypothetical protein